MFYNTLLAAIKWYMVSHKLSQIYNKKHKQYFCSIISLFVVLYENIYNQFNYFWYYRPFIIDQFTINGTSSENII